MEFRMRAALLVSASALLVATLAPIAIAGTANAQPGIWQDSGGRVSSGARGSQGRDRTPRNPGREQDPLDETPVAPVPEPGTMALLSLGVVSLAAGLRKRRAGRPTVSGTIQ